MRMTLTSEWPWHIFSLLAGCLLTLAFAPFELGYLALVVTGFAYFSWKDVTPGRAFRRGYLFGLGLFGSGVSWVYVSIHDYGGSTVFGALLLTGAFVCFWALFPALTAWLFNHLTQKIALPVLVSLIFAIVWIIIEYFRGEWLLNGFPWLQVGYSQLDGPLAGFVPVFGSYGVGGLLLLSAGLLVEIISDMRKQSLLLGFLLFIWISGVVLRQFDWTHEAARPLTVSLIQGNIPQDKKWQSDVRVKTLRRYRELTQQHAESDLIIWPETAIPAYQSQVEDFYLQPLAEWAKQNQLTLVAGVPDRNPKTGQNYNKLIVLGENSGAYNKNHLLPFGEYLPLQPLSGWILDALGLHLGQFSPGGRLQPLIQVKGYPFASSICYEDAFAAVFLPTLPAATFLVNITNDAWFGHSIEAQQHMQIARARALETGRYLLRVTNTGITGIVAPNGKIIAQLPAFKEAVLTQDFTPRTGMTPFAGIGNEKIMVALALILGVVIGIPRLRRAKA